MSAPDAVRGVVRQFLGSDRPARIEPFGPGHINASYLVTTSAPLPRRLLLQRLNTDVFKSPEWVFENIARVTAHIAGRLSEANLADGERRTLQLLSTPAGQPFLRDELGHYWRLYPYIERTRTYTAIRNPHQAEQAARAFGTFQTWLYDLPAPRLHETIPGFHDTPRRLAAFRAALDADAFGRAADAQAEVAFAQEQAELANALTSAALLGELPERIVHNDAKITNVLFDADTDESLCVVDLDTVMPGLAMHDFGDMMRTMATTAEEDEPDVDRVRLDLGLFAGLARGYLDATRSFLTQAEREQLVTAGIVITYEQGLRFLTDYLAGDAYYRTSRPAHNLERCRTQFKLVREFLAREEALRDAIGVTEPPEQN